VVVVVPVAVHQIISVGAVEAVQRVLAGLVAREATGEREPRLGHLERLVPRVVAEGQEGVCLKVQVL
jgi:hypothetical protein